jgi:hypothetical protein
MLGRKPTIIQIGAQDLESIQPTTSNTTNNNAGNEQDLLSKATKSQKERILGLTSQPSSSVAISAGVSGPSTNQHP